MNLLDNLPVGIITFDEKFNVNYINNTFFLFDMFTEMQRKELTGKPITELPGISTEIKNEIKELTNLIPFEKEIYFNEKISGKFLSVIVKGTPLEQEEIFKGGVLLFEDLIVITETHTEDFIRTKQFKEFISTITDFYLLTDKKGKLIYSSDSNVKNLFSIEEITKSIKEKNLIVKSNKGNYFKISHKPVILKSGGNVFEFIALNDVTNEIEEREKLLTQLKSAQISNGVLDAISTAAILVNELGEIEFYNRKALSLMESNEINKKKIATFFPEINNSIISEAIFPSQKNTLNSLDVTFGNKYLNVSISKFGISDSLALIELSDITSTKSIIGELQSKLKVVKKLFYRKNVLLKYDGKSALIELSENPVLAKEIFGEEKRKITELIPTETENLFPQNESIFEFSKNGRTFFAHVIRDNDLFYLGIADETERVREKEKLNALKNQLNNLIENSSEFYWESEKKEGKFTVPIYSPSVKKITGYSQSQFQENRNLWLKLIHPNDKKELIHQLRLLYSNKAVNEKELLFRIINRSRKIIWLREQINLKRDSEGNIEKIFATVQDVSSLMNRQEKLEKQVAELEAMNNAKDRFVSIISHDLRTPFSSVLGFTDLLLNDNTLPEDKRSEYIRYIQDSSNTMLKLVNSLLDWTRLQTGRIEFNPEKLSLKESVEESIGTVRGTAMTKGIKLSSDISNQLFVHADRNLISQVFNNLIGNAIKFTKAGDNISITAKRLDKENKVEITISDTGIGIRKEDIPKLFRPDSKITNLGTAGEKGTGLGLSLVSEIIKKHRGEIKVESELGKGTKFIFTLPVSSSLILLADRNQTDLLLYSKLIKSLFPEFIIETAKEKDEIERIVLEKAPVLIITETKMNDYSIYNLLEFIRLNEKKIKPSVIILTREISAKETQTLKTQGVNYVFSKPVDLSDFRNKILDAIKRKG